MGLRSLPFFKAKKGWQIAGGGLSADGGGGGSLPIATPTTLGGVKIGDGLSISNDGILSTIGGGKNYTNIPAPVGSFNDKTRYGVLLTVVMTNSGNNKTIDVSQYNIDNIIVCEGFVDRYSSTQPYQYNISSWNYDKTNKNLLVNFSGSAYDTNNVYVYIEYTTN